MPRRDGTPSRSGPSGASIPDEERGRPAVRITLAPETIAWLDSHAPRGRTVDALVAAEIRREKRRGSP